MSEYQKKFKKMNVKEIDKVEYPYYHDYYQFNKKNILQKVKDFTPIIYHQIPKELIKIKNKVQTFDKSYFLIKDIWIKNQELNDLTDYFSEHVRVKCIFGNKLSPYDFWKKNKKKIIYQTIQKFNILNYYYLRETIFFNIKLCNNFRISLVLSILHYFKPKSYLDISAGWGDRLLGSILSNVVEKYVSADPNLDLHPCYEKIKNTFLPPKMRDQFIIYPTSFTDIPLKKDELFDMVFSSPPFFTLEKYSTHSKNSITQFPNEEEWINNFFVPAMMKCYHHLKKDGIMILYMGGSKEVFQKMFELNKIMNYVGIIHFYDTNLSLRNMFVWKKY